MIPDALAPAILHGHALNVLGTLPDESVHCVVTSPPYWGLRAYGTKPQVWGGDASCVHSWENTTIPSGNGQVTHPMVGGTLNPASATRSPRVSLVCRDCSAWKGELGLEPAPELYVAHLADVFDAVWRVLRADGTLWLNLGDTYCTHPVGRPGRSAGRPPPSRSGTELGRSKRAPSTSER